MEFELLKEQEVSARYSLSVPWLRRARRELRGPVFLKLGDRMVRYRAVDVEAYLAASAVQTRQQAA
jgi:predicted DNA-binding transcriptional regulator AlpA